MHASIAYASRNHSAKIEGKCMYIYLKNFITIFSDQKGDFRRLGDTPVLTSTSLHQSGTTNTLEVDGATSNSFDPVDYYNKDVFVLSEDSYFRSKSMMCEGTLLHCQVDKE